ncbi:PRC-barrel domain-containing protein [Dyadobacter sp. CY326]|uniref:PRC-barrel domain-containing protein n=1 Tax=Dyadobacter sp. CY326 TaxID=2907300 RepID=UPI001F48081E|nr:PRC-barrel domain-containing protein [Dyadobacter sp. CY326]MCE7063896.1 PRC-barrel domain-containing protein [Dyadobacter sp. CY326]
MDINESNANDRLEKLGSSDFEIADGQPNIKGWDVKDTNGNYLGEVEELIFDKESRKVRYLVVDLDDNELDIEEKVVLVPIGLATLHEADDDVILGDLTATRLNLLPAYEKEEITVQFESKIRNTFTGLAAALAAGADTYQSHPEGFYDHEHFNEKQFYANRRKLD